MRGDGEPKRRLRVGVVIDADPLLDPWELRLFEQLAASETIHLAFVIALPDPAPAVPRSPALERILSWEARLVKRGAAPAMGLSLSALSHLPSYAPASKRHKPADVLLYHARQSVPTGVRFRESEVWRYSILSGGEDAESLGLSGVLNDDPYAAVSLERLDPENPAAITGTVASARTNTKRVGTYNAAFAADILPTLVVRELNAHRLGLAPVEPLEAPDRPGKRATATPLAYAGRLAGRLGSAAAERGAARLGAVPGQWSLLIGQGDILATDFNDLTELAQPANEHRADPFLFRMGSDDWVFYEAFGGNHPHGQIFAGRLAGDQLVDEQPVNLGAIHLSFPFVFRHGDEVFMVPETHQRDRVEVWRCVEFPGRWVLHAHALEGTAPADSTLFEHGGTWWLFTSHGSGEMPDYCRELHIYQVDGPDLGGLTPHARNPVMIDTTCARMGGRPFQRDGKLYRPGQNSSYGLYGYGLTIMEIETLTLTSYAERVARRIEPIRRSGTTGCHHLDVGPGSDGTGPFILDARRAIGRPLLRRSPIALKGA